MKISRHFKKQAGIYKLFIPSMNSLDLSKTALMEMYLFESRGIGDCNVQSQHLEYLKTRQKINGYAVGKKFLNISVAMWFDTLKQNGWMNFLIELKDNDFPNWWLDKIFKDFLKSKNIKGIEYVK